MLPGKDYEIHDFRRDYFKNPTRKCLNEHDSGETMKAQPRHSTYSCIRTEAGNNPIHSMDIQYLNST